MTPKSGLAHQTQTRNKVTTSHLNTGLKYPLLLLLSARTRDYNTLHCPSSCLLFALPTATHNKPQVCLASPPAISLPRSRHLPTSSVKDNTQYILGANLPKGIWCFRQCYFPDREHTLLTGKLAQKQNVLFLQI